MVFTYLKLKLELVISSSNMQTLYSQSYITLTILCNPEQQMLVTCGSGGSCTYILLRSEYLQQRQQDLSISQVQEQILHQRLVVL